MPATLLLAARQTNFQYCCQVRGSIICVNRQISNIVARSEGPSFVSTDKFPILLPGQRVHHLCQQTNFQYCCQVRGSIICVNRQISNIVVRSEGPSFVSTDKFPILLPGQRVHHLCQQTDFQYCCQVRGSIICVNRQISNIVARSEGPSFVSTSQGHCDLSQSNKINKITCAPSQDSDQPGHPPSLIRVFAVRMKKPCVLSYP